MNYWPKPILIDINATLQRIHELESENVQLQAELDQRRGAAEAESTFRRDALFTLHVIDDALNKLSGAVHDLKRSVLD